MSANTSLYLLGCSVSILAALLMIPIIVAVDAEEWNMVNVFISSMVLCAFVGGALVSAFRGSQPHLNRVGTIWLSVLIWGLMPPLAALPFFLSGHFEAFVDAYFESVSGLTTTGATVILVLEDVPAAIIAWRAVLQWLGGALTLLTAMLVLSPLGVSGTPGNISIPGYERRDIPRSVIAMARDILPIYALLTLVCMLLLRAFGVPAFEAMCLGFSAISTGGFEVRSGGIGAYGSPGVETVLAVFMIVGATSILSHRFYFHGFGRGQSWNKETRRLIIIALVAGLVISVLAAVASVTGDNKETILDNFLNSFRIGLFRAISLITTTGFDNADASTLPVPFVIALVLCIIGGASFSTAGGLKQFRFLVLMEDAERELARLVHPHVVSPSRIAGRIVDRALVRSTWALFATMIFAIAVFGMLLAFRDLSFENALIAAVAALTNNGPALGMATAPNAPWLDYANMSGGSLITLSAAMLLGRLELLLVLCMFTSTFWEE